VSKASDLGSAYVTKRFNCQGLDADALTDFLTELVRSDPRNALPEGNNIPIWDPPVVGVAAADDPIFETLKKPGVVGPIHESPDYWLAGAKSVISFFLPFTREVKKSYDWKSALPSLEWVSSRQNGEVFVNVARRAVARLVEQHGGTATVPNLQEHYRAVNMLPMWSERHVAFIAGIGTFGLHAGFISEKGVAGRIGSVVTDLELAPTPRPYTEVYEYCPWFSDGSCGVCIPRCPVKAIDDKGKDHMICRTNGALNIGPAFKEWGYHACGHCSIHLPCMSGIPPRHARLRAEAGEGAHDVHEVHP
jgi:ferredoxin